MSPCKMFCKINLWPILTIWDVLPFKNRISVFSFLQKRKSSHTEPPPSPSNEGLQRTVCRLPPPDKTQVLPFTISPRGVHLGCLALAGIWVCNFGHEAPESGGGFESKCIWESCNLCLKLVKLQKRICYCSICSQVPPRFLIPAFDPLAFPISQDAGNNTACVCKLFQSCPTLCDPMDCSPPGSSVHGILQARILEHVAMPSSRGSFPTQGSKQLLLHLWQAGSLPLAQPGKPDNKTNLFQSCGHGWVFQICWHNECSTLTASSFR